VGRKVMAKSKKEPAKQVDISKHILVPKHVKLSEKERREILMHYRINISDLPKISIKDPAIANMDVSIKDIIKIIRPSRTAGISVFYRRVAK
jgi:DNA-directed RNA polymerase subunit H (RpoH/RPB5)